MSGFEVVGVILGVYPVIVDALALYKATKAGKGAASLSRNLRTESIIFGEFVYNLLAPNVCPDELTRLKDPRSADLELWKDATLHAHFKDRLGSEKAEVVVEILQEIHALLRSLELELSAVPTEHTIELLRKFRATIRNVKLNLPQSSIRERLEELTTYNGQLQRLFTDRSIPSNVIPTTKAVPVRRYLRRECGRAVDIYNAVCNSYQCDCESPHVANFGLPRLSDNFQADSNGFIGNWQFEFLFAVDDRATKDDGGASGLEIETLVATWSKLRVDAPIAASHRELRRQGSRSICISECDRILSDGQQSHIPDLCIFVKSLGSSAHISNTSQGNLRLAETQYQLRVPLSVQDIEASPNIVCLDDLLTSQRFPLSRQERINLALRLSYAILEFYLTPWIETCWTWKDFCIDKHNDAQLFVTQKFYSSRGRTLSSCSKGSLSSAVWAIHGEPILTRLGFALIELAMGRRLAELRQEDQYSSYDPDTRDFLTAQHLIDSGRIRQEESRDYEDVVKTCLNHEYLRMSDLIRLDSKGPTFQDNVEQKAKLVVQQHGCSHADQSDPPSPDWSVDLGVDDGEVPDWVRETMAASRKDERTQPWKATFGQTVDCRMDDGEDLVTVEKSVGGGHDPSFPFKTQGSSLCA
ncbi:hypothetical protein MMC11_009001 [Xylographa trunciseda]|nr:hypothetical protein [Xylographa trunciseda]